MIHLYVDLRLCTLVSSSYKRKTLKNLIKNVVSRFLSVLLIIKRSGYCCFKSTSCLNYWIHVTNINDLNEVEKETVYHHLNPDIGPFAET